MKYFSIDVAINHHAEQLEKASAKLREKWGNLSSNQLEKLRRDIRFHSAKIELYTNRKG